MPVRELGELSWTDVQALDRSRVVVILPLGAVEAHGPHLPLGTDVIIAEAMARAGAELLAPQGIQPLMLPTLSYAPAPYAADFAGTISIEPQAVTSTIHAIASSVARHGIRFLALANAHFDPAQVRALRDATHGTDATVIFPDLTRRALAQRLTAEFQSGACHAGRYETSIVMAARPELVHETLRTALPANNRSLVEAQAAGQTTFKAAGGSDAYFGAPAEASAAEGRESIARLGAILADAVREAMT
ncbi:MAG TPA: creatininase family protein [Gemmatimonadales bacterium]|nr:creatininase family protein [Gemmatimonadales bacterium]